MHIKLHFSMLFASGRAVKQTQCQWAAGIWEDMLMRIGKKHMTVVIGHGY